MKAFIKLLIKWFYPSLEDELIYNWEESRIENTKDFHILSYTTKTPLSTAERTTLMASEFGLGGAMSFQVTVDGKMLGERTFSVKDVADRAIKEHYEEMYKNEGAKFTQLWVHRSGIAGDVNGIECKTTVIKHK